MRGIFLVNFRNHDGLFMTCLWVGNDSLIIMMWRGWTKTSLFYMVQECEALVMGKAVIFNDLVMFINSS